MGLCGYILIIFAILANKASGITEDPSLPSKYNLQQMPRTGFTCLDKILGSYYADPDTNCQLFHVCVKVSGVGIQDFRFLCPNNTAFDQEAQICADWGDVDCETSALFYGGHSSIFDLYRFGFESKKTTPAGEDESRYHLRRTESSNNELRRSDNNHIDNFDLRLKENNIENPLTKLSANQNLRKRPNTETTAIYEPISSTTKYNNNFRSRESHSLEEDIIKASQSSSFFSTYNGGSEDIWGDVNKGPTRYSAASSKNLSDDYAGVVPHSRNEQLNSTPTSHLVAPLKWKTEALNSHDLLNKLTLVTSFFTANDTFKKQHVDNQHTKKQRRNQRRPTTVSPFIISYSNPKPPTENATVKINNVESKRNYRMRSGGKAVLKEPHTASSFRQNDVQKAKFMTPHETSSSLMNSFIDNGWKHAMRPEYIKENSNSVNNPNATNLTEKTSQTEGEADATRTLAGHSERQLQFYKNGSNQYITEITTFKPSYDFLRYTNHLNNKNREINKSSTINKLFSTHVPRDHYLPTTFKPSTYKKYNHQFSLKNHYSKFKPASYLATNAWLATTTKLSSSMNTTIRSPKIDTDLFTKNSVQNKQKKMQSYSKSTRVPHSVGRAGKRIFPTSVKIFGDEFFDTAYSANIAEGVNGLIQKEIPEKPHETTEKSRTHKAINPVNPNLNFASKEINRFESKTAHDDDDYDYYYYDTHSPHPDYVQYETLSELEKTKG